MYALLMCIAMASVGDHYGWQRMPEGGMQYIIQLDPPTLESLRDGAEIKSYIPAGAGEIRSYKIVVGTQPLPRDVPPVPAAPPKAEEPKPPDRKAAQPETPHPLMADPGVKPLAERTAAFEEPAGTSAAVKPPPKTPTEVQPEQPARPWLPLTFTLFGLFASLGANLFLGWIAWDFRQRYHAKCSAA